MKKHIFNEIGFAVIAALLCVTCGDNGIENPHNNGDAARFLDRINCSANPSSVGCPGYCPPTQSGCPGYVAPNPCAGLTIATPGSACCVNQPTFNGCTSNPPTNPCAGLTTATPGSACCVNQPTFNGCTSNPPTNPCAGLTIATPGSACCTAQPNYSGCTSTPTTTYTITFDPNGGSVNPAYETTRTDGKLAFLPTPTRPGYTFGGWFTSLSDGWAVTENTMFSANTTIFARWNAIPTPTKTLFTDSRDGKRYNKVTIGTQTWMAENLNYAGDGGECYENNADSCAKYGRLYNWTTAMADAKSSSANPSGVQGVCPFGWHLPSDAEWDVLMVAVDGVKTTADADKSGGAGDGYWWHDAGTKLKSKTGWDSSDGVPAGSDTYGFSALPGGSGYGNGAATNVGAIGFWRSATERDNGYAWYRNMYYGSGTVGSYTDQKARTFSVRCVQD